MRAGAKRLGRKKPLSQASQAYVSNRAYVYPVITPHISIQRPRFIRDDQPYIPPTKPYELSALAIDLVLLARYMLRPGGRLVFFLPTVNEDYAEIDVHSLLCDGMEVIANSLQDFGSWDRRVRIFLLTLKRVPVKYSRQLITIKKTSTEKFPPPTFDTFPATTLSTPQHTPAHRDFREKYFQGFRKEDDGKPTSPSVKDVASSLAAQHISNGDTRFEDQESST